MVGAGLPVSALFPIGGQRLLHGQWTPARGCLLLMFAIWVPAWILCGFTASAFWALGAASFWPRKDVKDLVRGRTRVPFLTGLSDRALDALFNAFKIP